MTESLANGYSCESSQRELSNEYQHDWVLMVFGDFCVLVLWTKVASALEGLTHLHLECTHDLMHMDSLDDKVKIWQKDDVPVEHSKMSVNYNSI